MSRGSALDKKTPGNPKGIFQRHQLLYFVHEGRSHGRAQRSHQSSLVGAFLCHLVFVNTKSTTSAHFKSGFAQRLELKRCVLTWALLGCVAFVVKLLLSSFISLKNNPWSTRCFFFCLSFVVQQTRKGGFFCGEVPLVLTHLCVSLCPPFVLRSWVTSSSHTVGSYQISLYFLSGASLDGEPSQHSQVVKLCLVKLQGNGGGNGGFPPLQGGKLRTGKEDGCGGPGEYSALISATIFMDF